MYTYSAPTMPRFEASSRKSFSDEANRTATMTRTSDSRSSSSAWRIAERLPYSKECDVEMRCDAVSRRCRLAKRSLAYASSW